VTVDNHSATAQTELPVYAVALKGGQVVGAGRGVVASLARGASSTLEIPMIGSVDASTIVLTAAPTPAR
jgi:hypothetical protein